MVLMRYEKPIISDLGSIADHTFGGTNPGGQTPPKDETLCTKDMHMDESCPTP
jgi:hypothetical protein